MKAFPALLAFLFAAVVGFGVCYLSYRICHRIFFRAYKLHTELLYTFCTIGAIIWGVVAVNNLPERNATPIA